MNKKNKKKNVFATFVILAVIVGLLGFNSFSAFFTGKTDTVSTRDLAMSCTLDMYTKFHIHPHLMILVNGEQQVIPANTGINPGCMHPLHTHDDTGTVHVESPEERDFTLGDFFAVWGKTFTKDQILDSKIDASHTITMLVDGSASDQYDN